MENTKLRASQKYKKRSTFDSIWRQLRKNKGAIVGMILLVVIIIIALASPYIFNYETDVIANNVKERMQHPSSEHWFGTDDLGRDIFALRKKAKTDRCASLFGSTVRLGSHV